MSFGSAVPACPIFRADRATALLSAQATNRRLTTAVLPAPTLDGTAQAETLVDVR
jgi:hypothetical protein